jgi:cytochrome P450
LMSAVAHPLPSQLLRELLGVPGEHEARFRVLTADIARGLDPSLFLSQDEIARRDGARAELGEVFTALAEQRRSDPGDDLISQLVAVEDEGRRLTMHELRVTCTLLLAAGYATTHGLIANGMLALLQRPAQRDWLRANPDGMDNAVEEMLRFDAPVQMIARTALTEVTLDDHPIQPGEQVMLLIGAANRDPAVFEDPDELLLSRENPRNLGFGLGIHFCLGAPLARLAARAAVAELAALDIELATSTPPRVPNIIMRSLAELPARIAG